MVKSILKNLINIIYWGSFFTDTSLLEFVGLGILILLLKFSLSSTEYNVIKNKFGGFLTLIFSNLLVSARIENPFIASVLALLVLVNTIAVFYHLILMVIFSSIELKELKFF